MITKDSLQEVIDQLDEASDRSYAASQRNDSPTEYHYHLGCYETLDSVVSILRGLVNKAESN